MSAKPRTIAEAIGFVDEAFSELKVGDDRKANRVITAALGACLEELFEVIEREQREHGILFSSDGRVEIERIRELFKTAKGAMGF